MYFFNNPSIWPLYGSIIVPQTFFMLAVYAAMYLVVYPFYALLSFLAFGPFGVISAFFTVLQYSNMILNFLISVVFMPGARDLIFDAVLSREGQAELVIQLKLRRKTHKQCIEKLKVAVAFLFEKLPFLIFHEVLILFAGMIPAVGPCLVILIRAPCKGRSLHSRYYKLKGWDKHQIREFDIRNRGSYMGIGVAALLLEFIPFLTILTLFTNTVGAALWTIHLESQLVQKDGVDTAKTGSNTAFVTGAELRSQEETSVLV